MDYKLNKIAFFILLLLPYWAVAQSDLPAGFVYLEDSITSLQYELQYHSEDNFVGRCIDGYYSDRVIVTRQAAIQLIKIQKELSESGLSLYVFDAYRPQDAVDQFVLWAKDLKDTLRKQDYYPDVKKSQLFNQGYISSHSRHSSGSTIDLTIAHRDGRLLDMGSSFDFFGEISHVDYHDLTELQQKNRQLLQSIMSKYGFRSYSKEWWHFTLRNEPYYDQHFNFSVH